MLMLTVAAVVGAVGKRTVLMQIDLPNGATPQVKVVEGEAASIELKGGGKFGFVPSFGPDNESIVSVTVFDLKTTPHRQLTAVDVPVGGDSVRTDTTPAFAIRVVEVRAQQ
jgi:hypothetical protein